MATANHYNDSQTNSELLSSTNPKSVNDDNQCCSSSNSRKDEPIVMDIEIGESSSVPVTKRMKYVSLGFHFVGYQRYT